MYINLVRPLFGYASSYIWVPQTIDLICRIEQTQRTVEFGTVFQMTELNLTVDNVSSFKSTMLN